MSEERELSFLEQVEQSAENLIKYGRIYNDEEKAKMLNMLPYVEEDTANKAAVLSYEVEMLKLKLKRLKNTRLLEAVELKDTLDLKNQTDRVAWAEDCDEYRKLEEEIIEKKKEQELLSHKAERLNKQFASINKLITKDINSDYLLNTSQRRIG